VNPTRTGLLDVLGTMGADIEVIDRGMWGPEPVADIRVRSARLTAAEIGPELVPRMIDEFPGFVLAAAMARGRTRIAGADELRRKKSDRISSVIQEYRRLGVEIEERLDGMVITGGRVTQPDPRTQIENVIGRNPRLRQPPGHQ
jgi:3-phosphoshikimate 1-carboxyvinyltransferase